MMVLYTYLIIISIIGIVRVNCCNVTIVYRLLFLGIVYIFDWVTFLILYTSADWLVMMVVVRGAV